MKPKPNAFLKIVKERPDTSLSVEYPYCPYCRNHPEEGQLELKGHSHTLVGGGAGRDVNHHHREYFCNSCKKEFYMENKGSVVWYTEKDTGKILDGIPACFERYVYTCKKCNGDVRRHQVELDSDEPVSCLRYNGGVPQYRTFFKCDDCGLSIQSANGHFSWEAYIPTRRRKTNVKPRMRLGWVIVEEPGIVILNDDALTAVDFDAVDTLEGAKAALDILGSDSVEDSV